MPFDNAWDKENIMEDKQTKRWVNIFIGIFLLLIVGFFVYGFSVAKQPAQTSSALGSKVTPTIALADYFSYKGQIGKSALNILKEKASVDEASSGLVIGINGRKADNNTHEYWAFYVNGKLANTGPADYQTKNSDLIEWKIETY